MVLFFDGMFYSWLVLILMEMFLLFLMFCVIVVILKLLFNEELKLNFLSRVCRLFEEVLLCLWVEGLKLLYRFFLMV